jgi:hypothetical protein
MLTEKACQLVKLLSIDYCFVFPNITNFEIETDENFDAQVTLIVI